MKMLFLSLTAAMLAGCSSQPASTSEANQAPAAVTANSQADVAEGDALMLTAADGERVFGTIYRAAQPKAIILLFHQAGSSKEEYATIGPRLAKAGYSALAIDQRSGGDMFGGNQTVQAAGGSTGYLDAIPDLEAALAWAQAQSPRLPIAVWGSSYSSSLVFPLVAAHPQAVKAVLAFSPGEYFDDKSMVRKAAAKVDVPVFITSAPGAEEVDRAKAIYDALPGDGNVRYVPQQGVHGSSTLIVSRDPQGAETNWQAVMAFLNRTLG
ncbi:alpha/beta hydrolase [Stakelama marina]|uniref:Alpha/beta hydrolase n=1 Tax=Stakelama marina TaxID=2826939 RepID=A0A8T4IIL9_9SPHN|nr:alpha/beta fold hydrolase [Stakelama marina]MBR0552159.1 alpha/beta hydrolase [Stakelama marina]